MRISAHKLHIETGRHKNTPRRDKRICTFCDSGSIEDETHFLIYCKKFEEIRSNFFATMEDVFQGFTQLLDQEKVKLILSEPTICKVSAKFIADIYEDRG
jgi:hypothetical protein